MDTRPAPQQHQQGAAATAVQEPPKDLVAAQLVAERLEIIKRHMPNVLACIQDRAQHYGTEVYALVRRGLRGEPGCFYGIEGGYVMGTPMGLDQQQVFQDHARFIVRFGCAHLCVWPERVWQRKQGGGGDGTA